ncbi:MAG: pilus assembly protein PilM [Candidatus Marinimicrobia bacterium]|nr:pilus assembly protein PilM [Candidatus Neomarinimicrobiota bacterium]
MSKQKKIKIGIDIGNNSIKLACYYVKKKNRNQSQLLKYDFLEEDVVKDIREVNETHIMNGIKSLLSETPYRRADINVGLSSSYQNLFFLQLPQIASHEIKQALFWELAPLLADPADQYDFDYALLPQNQKKKINILLAVIKKNRIEWLQKVFKSLSTSLKLLETSTLPTVDLFYRSNPKMSETIGILQLGGNSSHYTIVDPAQHPEFLYLPFGGNTLNRTISKVAGIPFVEVEYLRRGVLELSSNGDPITTLYMQNPKIENQLKELALTIRKLNFRHFYNTGQKTEKLYVTGGLLNDSFIRSFITLSEDIMEIPAEIWDPIPEHFPDMEITTSNAYQFSTAIGLALR